MRKSKLFTKMMHACLILTMLGAVTGCGKEDAASENPAAEMVYVPAFTDISIAEASWMDDVQVAGDIIYTSYNVYDEETYSSEVKIVRKSLKDGTDFEEVPLKLTPTKEGYSVNLYSFRVNEDGSIMVLTYEYPMYDPEADTFIEYEPVYAISRYDKDGNQLMSSDITEALKKDEENSYVHSMLIDTKGNTFLASNSVVYLFDADGAYTCTFDTKADYVNGLSMDKEGIVYASAYGMDYDGIDMYPLNVETKQIGEKSTGCPNTNSNGNNGPGIESGILVAGSDALFEYHPATNDYDKILTWVDCNINGTDIQSVQVNDEGVIYVFCSNYDGETSSYELVSLTKTDSSQVVKKEEIVVGSMYSDQQLQAAAVKFNKASDKYKITLKVYIPDDLEWSENTYADALTRMNADMTGSECPDLMAISYLNIENLVAKGLIEDLTPYLESSSVISREDFLDNVIESSTINGVLAYIPGYVNLQGIIGRASQIGDREGWTIDEFIEFVESYPDKETFSYVTKDGMLSTFLNQSVGDFVDYETGKCSFDSEGFIRMLEFCNRYDAEYNYDEEKSLPDMVQSGAQLLEQTGFSGMTEYQMYSLMFPEEIKVIGYPTTDGKGGIKLSSYNNYAMTTKADNKEGAWAFLESMMQYEKYDEWRHNGFPTRKDMLEEMFTAAMTPDYIYDDNGEIMLDDNGEKLEEPKTHWSYDNWDAEIYAATPEQVEAVRALLEQGEMQSSMDEELYAMIAEETAAYFAGQKTAQEVAKIVQSRAQIYLNENM